MLSTTILVASLFAPSLHGPLFPKPDPPPPPTKEPEDPGSGTGPTPPRRTPGAPGGAPGGNGPQRPTSPGPKPVGPKGGLGPLTPGGAAAVDDLSWRLWWRFNGAEWIRLKAAVHRPPTATGDDFMDLGAGQRGRADLAPTGPQLDAIAAALVESLGRESADDALTGALMALGKLGRRDADPPRAFVARFEALLASGSQEVSETAALALGVSGEPAGLPLLRALANDDERGRRAVGGGAVRGAVPTRTRAFALYGIGMSAATLAPGPETQRVALDLVRIFEGADDATGDLRIAALLALAQVPLDDSPLAPLRDAEGLPLEGAQHVLSRRSLLAWMLGVLERRDVDRRIRAHASTSLARMARLASDETRATLLPRLTERLSRAAKASAEERQSVVLALGHLADCDDDEHDEDARAALRQVLADGQPPERRFALMALARVAARDGAGENAGDARPELRRALMTVLARGKSGLKPWAGLALGVLGRERLDLGEEPDAEVDSALRSALASERSPEPLLAYALALGLRRDVDSKGVLLDAFERVDDPSLSGELALAVGLLGEPSVGPLLRERLERAKYRPRELEQVAVALALLGDKQATTVLDRMLSEARSLGSQAAVAQALGVVGDRRTTGSLLDLLVDGDATASARAFAAVGLGDLADRRMLPWALPLSSGLGYRTLTPTLVGDGKGVLDLR